MSDNSFNLDAECTTLVDILRWRALNQPDRRAYTFLVDGETEETHLAYGELDRRARAIGSLLQYLGASGERVLLLYPPGLEYIAAFFGCLYAEAVAVPSYPPRLSRPDSRLRAILADSRSTVALTTSDILSTLERRFAHTLELRSLHWEATDGLADDLAEAWCNPVLDSATLAFLQYTSGSTAMPKGVMVSHGNIMYNERMIQQVFGQTEESIVVGWLPIYHDMGLIGNVLQPLFTGAQCILMSPLDFLQSPVRWLQMISRYRGCTSGGPNFAYDLCVYKVTPEQREALDLSSWTVAFNGAEPVRHQTIRRFIEAFEPCGFRGEAFHPCYGLAEATLLVSGGTKSEPSVFCGVQGKALEQDRAVAAPPHAKDARILVGCGRTVLDQKIVIVNPETSIPSPPNHVGEIWVAGCNVALGYWDRPDETEYVFRAYLADTGEGPFLRTGDLGFLENGELFITGRLKDLIIIRGRNYYPQDIELTMEQCHPALRPGCGAAFSVDVADEERLVVVQEVKRTHRKANVDEMAQAVCQAIAEEHSLEVYAVVLLKPMSIPKTSSGKIQRRACRESFLSGTLNSIGEWRQAVQDPESYSTKDNGRVGLSEQALSAEAIQAWLISHLSKHLGSEPQSIDVRAPFTSFGLDSMQAVSLSGELSDWLGRRLSPTLAWEYPSIEALSRYLTGQAQTSTLLGQDDTGQEGGEEPIAIIGIGCRFPGAHSPETFWKLLRDGVDAIIEVPPKRWDAQAFYDPDPEVPGKAITRWGGFLEDIDQFDPYFFGISPREAARIDPQQRLLLEVTWEALEDAGQAVDKLAGSRTGVFIGISTNDYGRIQFSQPELIDAYAGTGNAFSVAANRVSYLFDFRGPSIAVDTACSSSLVAVHSACCSLWSGESTLALAGGVNLILSPAVSIGFTKAGVMSPDGRCKVFDAQANGYVRGEGVAVVVLKPFSKALADSDPIYAVIRGSAVNHDGRTNGLMAPSPQAQEAVLREAYRRAGVSPGLVQYVEAHGTGTFLGDPIEAKALGAVLSAGRSTGQPCVIGSVKSNVGHLEAAAGITGLIKVALSLEHREIPPSLHFVQPNPHIPFDELKLHVQRTLGPWPDETRPFLAGVSSFGFGGTNAHVVVEQAPEPLSITTHCETSFPDQMYLLPISAHSEEALYSLVQSYRDFLTNGALESGISSQDICYTASARRSHHDYRLALVGHAQEEWVEGLEAFLRGETHRGLSSGRRVFAQQKKIVFVFPGQGSQWVGMGRELFEKEPVFGQTLEQCDQLIQRYANWSLLEQIAADEAHSQLDEIDVIQPTLFAVQVGLAALWRSWGIEPNAVVGHSMGEVAAAHVAGVLSLEDAVRIICLRSQLLKRISGQGAMVFAGLSIEQAQVALIGYEGQISVAVSNGPTSTVLSGEPVALDEVMERLQSQDVFCRRVQVDVAAHSPQTDPLRSELVESLEGLRPQAALVPIYSTVLGEIRAGEAFDANYWGQNLRQPVLFSAAVQTLLGDGYGVFLEISSHPILLNAIEQALHHWGKEGVTLPSLRREGAERATLLESLGALYVQGYPLNWDKLYPVGRCVRLPFYPWQRERFWLDLLEQGSGAWSSVLQSSSETTVGHPLLGQPFQSSIHPEAYFWQMNLGDEALSYLDDHCIQGVAVLPAAVYIEMALAAVREVVGSIPCILKEVAFQNMLAVLSNRERVVQLAVSLETSDQAFFQVSSAQDRVSRQMTWTTHASGQIHFDQVDPVLAPPPVSIECVRERCIEEISGEEHYQALELHGLEYGPSFRRLTRIWRRDGEAVGFLHFTEEDMSKCDAYCISPVVLDACFQVLAAAISEDEFQVLEGGVYLPTGIDSLRIYNQEQVSGQGWGYACIRSGLDADGAGISGDVFLLQDDGRVMLEVSGLCLKRLDAGNLVLQQDIDDWLYEVEWQPQACLQQDRLSEQKGAWLVFVDDGGVGQKLKAFLEACGETCVLVFSAETYEVQAPGYYQLNLSCPEDFKRLFEDVLGSTQALYRGIVYLWGLTASKGGPVLSALGENVVESCAGVLHLVQALARIDWHIPPRLWIVTSDVQSLVEDAQGISVIQAPLWGLGRTIVHEYPELRCTLIDLSSADTTSAVEKLFYELWEDNEEDQIVLRGDMRYVARLAQYKAEAQNDFSISSEGTYLITGGLGGLGMTVAQWLVRRGARHLVLLSRGTGSPSAHETLRNLQKTGAQIILGQVDVTQQQQVANTLADIDRSMPPLRGIFHLAGILDDATLLQLTRERFELVMAAKVSGSWILHELTLEEELDFFVLFSSATSVLGSPGQGNYVAANAFLDALAHHRHTLGKPALSINWGPWAKVGLAAQPERGGRLTFQGIGSINPKQGGEVLDRLLGQDVAQISVIPVNWPLLFRRYPIICQLPLLANFVYGKSDGLTTRNDWEGERVQIRDRVLAAEPVERQQMLEAYLKDQLKNVLGATMTKLDLQRPIQELGVDSLMAVKLKARIESDLGVVIPIVSFFEGLGLAQMASQVLDRMVEDTNAPTMLSRNQEGAEQLLAKIDKFSDEEVDALLGDLLDERGFSE